MSRRRKKYKTTNSIKILLIIALAIFFWPITLTILIIAIIIKVIKQTTKEDKEKNIQKKAEKQTSKEIGNNGENKVKYLLKEFAMYNTCYIINDYRAYWYEKTIQIDHILITKYEVLCIETKNYKGKIYGNRNNLNWTITYNTNSKEEMYNPIKQNENHINYLKFLLGDNIPIKNIVVFTGSANIEEIKNLKEIYTLNKFQNLLDNTEEKEEIDYNNIYGTLEINKSDITDEEHIQNIQKYIE